VRRRSGAVVARPVGVLAQVPVSRSRSRTTGTCAPAADAPSRSGGPTAGRGRRG